MMRINPWLSSVLAGGWLLLSGGNAHADTKFEMGARLGYGAPFGKFSDTGGKVNDLIVGQIPLWLDVGARLEKRFFVGVYWDYGFGISSSKISDGCKADQAAGASAGVDVSCNTHDMRLGGEFLYHISPLEQFDPWVGVGFGYEWVGLSETESAGDASATLTVGAHGFEFMNLQLGLDISVSENVALGPFAAFTLAEYRKASVSCSGDCAGTDLTSSTSLDGKTLHEWLLLGARITYQL
jgi:hypothetical protein